MVQYYLINYILIIILSIVLIFFVLSRKRSREYFLFSIFLFSLAFWSSGRLAVMLSGDADKALLFARFLYLGSIFVYLFFLHFILSYLGLEKMKKIVLSIFYVNAFFLLFANFFDIFSGSNFFLEGVDKKFFSYYFEVPGRLYITQTASNLLIPLFAFYVLIKEYIASHGLRKNQIRYVLIASLIGFVGGATFLLPIYGYNIQPVGAPLILIQFLVVAYAITRYRFMGIRVIFKNILSFVLLALFFVLTLFSAFFLYAFLLPILGVYSFLVAMSLISLIFSSILFLFYGYAKNFLEYLIYGHLDPRRSIKDYALRLRKASTLSEASGEAMAVIKESIGCAKIVTVYGAGGRKKKFRIFGKNDFISLGQENLPLIEARCRETRQIIIRDEFFGEAGSGAKDDFSALLFDTGINMIIPLWSKTEFIGAVIIGDKMEKEGFAKEDIEFAESYCSYASFYLSNLLNYEKIKDRNVLLEELQTEFLSISGNFLRTPIFSLKGILRLASKERGNPEALENYLRAGSKMIERISAAVDNALTAAQIESGKFVMETKPTELVGILGEIYAEKADFAKEKQLDFKFKAVATKPVYVDANKSYLTQALGNLVDNAIRYTHSGSVIIKVELIEKRAVVSIIDTGPGFGEEKRCRMFNKFFKPDRLFEKGGMGLGMFIAKHLIKAHPDVKINVSNNCNHQGTTITVSFGVSKKIN